MVKLKVKHTTIKIILIVIVLTFMTVTSSFAKTATIDVRWDTFNKNQYDGALLLPAASDGSVEFVGGFGKSASKDGTVVTGDKEGSGFTGIGSLNSMHWQINDLKNGFYKFYLFCKSGGSQTRDDWSSDVKVTVTIDGNEKTISPAKKNGGVWEVFIINGATKKIEEKQTFYPVRHMIYGRVYNALTGQVLPNANVFLVGTDGKAVDGQIYKTDSNGFYLMHSFPIGRYKVVISSDRYIQTYQSADFILYDLPREMNFMMSPILKDTQFRIVLDWGASPADLDGHLNGPGLKPGESFHISYSNMHIFDKRHTLDIDDKNSYGPETITINGLDSGTYTFSIHNFSDRKQTSGSWNLASSSARVSVYQGAHLVGQYKVPEKDGTLWRVFQIDGDTGKITGVNKMLYETEPGVVFD